MSRFQHARKRRSNSLSACYQADEKFNVAQHQHNVDLVMLIGDASIEAEGASALAAAIKELKKLTCLDIGSL